MRNPELEEIEVIFFDLDDTLFDQQMAYQKTLCQIKDRGSLFEGVDVEKIIQAFEDAESEAYNEFRNGVSVDKLRWKRCEKILKKLGINEDFTETFHKEFYRIYPSIPIEIEGAGEVVKELESRYELGILSNSSKEIQMRKVHAVGLTEYFDHFIFSEEVDSRKPDKEIFLYALDEVGKSNDRCLHVGNSFRCDIKGAEKVGMWTCWLNRNDEKKGDGMPPDLEIKKLPELLEIFK